MNAREAVKTALEAWKAGDIRRCTRLCESVLEANPANPDALHILAIVAHHQNEYKTAVVLFKKALEQSPDNAEYLNNMGVTLSKLKHRPEAEKAFRDAVRLAPEHRDYLNNLAVCLLHQGAIAESSIYQKKSVELGGDAIQHHNLGLLLRRLDLSEEAEQAQLTALRMDPGLSAAWLYLVQLRDYTDPAHPDIKAIQRLLEDTEKSAEQRAELHFALGKCFEDCGQYKQSFDHYHHANRIMVKRLTHKLASTEHDLDAATRGFTRPDIWKHRLNAEDTPSPLIIVGMSRSGKTRLERLLAMHPDIHRGGELFAMPELAVGTLVRRYGPVLPAQPEPGLLVEAATKYREFIREQAQGKRLVTDSLPTNVNYLGFVALLFPDARIIYLQRDSADSLISIYFKHYGRGGHAYNYDPERIRARQQSYSRLMDAWQRLLPIPILNLHYEDLVRDPDGTAGKAVKFCGLEASPEVRKNWRAAGMNDHWIGRARRFQRYMEAAWDR